MRLITSAIYDSIAYITRAGKTKDWVQGPKSRTLEFRLSRHLSCNKHKNFRILCINVLHGSA